MSNKTDHFVFDKVLFFGRTYEDYLKMFDLDVSQWKDCRILDCPSGPASFVAKANEMGLDVVGCDPQYGNESDELFDVVMTDWTLSRERRLLSPQVFAQAGGHETDAYRQAKLEGFRRFAQDYKQGRPQGRYIKTQLPTLPFADQHFDLALSGNFLFLYSDSATGGLLPDTRFDYEFHMKALRELLRVAKEVRVYPLKGAHTQDNHPYLERVLADLHSRNIETEIVDVPFRDIAGAHHMLKLRSR